MLSSRQGHRHKHSVAAALDQQSQPFRFAVEGGLHILEGLGGIAIDGQQDITWQ